MRVLNLTAKSWRDRSGNVAIMTALLAPILVGAAGFAIDYAYASYIHQKLNRAAEAAVIGAVSQSAATAMGGYTNTNGLQQYGVGLFNANISQLSIGKVTPVVTVTSNGSGGVIAIATYSTTVATFFSSIVGIKSIPVSGSSQATASPTTYINYYIVVDVSQSMGIGATQPDMKNLYNLVVAKNNGSGGEVGCVFGCHVATGSQTQSNEALAHAPNNNPPIQLRIDSAVSAIQSIINDASNAAGSNKNIKIGLYTMSGYPANGPSFITTITAPISDYLSLQTLAATIDLGTNDSNGKGDSDFSDSLSSFNNSLPSNGTGASSTSPLNYVFIITDGLTDTSGSCAHGHCTGAFDPVYCMNLRAKAKIGIIYTTYIPIYKNNDPTQGPQQNYGDLVSPYVSQLGPNLQSCASSTNLYFEATDGPEIVSTMAALFKSTLNAATLQK